MVCCAVCSKKSGLKPDEKNKFFFCEDHSINDLKPKKEKSKKTNTLKKVFKGKK